MTNMLKPEYETYQDVKDTLARWTVPVWFCVLASFWYVVLLPAHRNAVTQLPGMESWVRQVGPIAAMVVLSMLVAHLMTHILEVHDHVYDRFVIRWRYHYARDKIIPKLLSPYKENLPEGFCAQAASSTRESLRRLFYPFAGDRDPQISQNLLVRFYERVTKYWFLQMNEVALLILVFGSGIYASPFLGWPWPSRFCWLTLVVAVLFTLNRLLAVPARRSVWKATEAEIEAIHTECEDSFEEALNGLVEDYGF
ncbi:MAG: hypothetical protein ACLFWL_11840 [Candidatus Brocadiia bacterium]